MTDAREATEYLRERALTSPAADFGAPADADAWLAALDLASPAGVATLVSAWDGTTSLYTSAGGGIIGAGEHEAVARATGSFVYEAGAWVEDMLPLPDLSYPEAGRVRFYVRRGDRCVCAEANEQDLTDGLHDMSGLYALAQAVITQVRRASS